MIFFAPEARRPLYLVMQGLEAGPAREVDRWMLYRTLYRVSMCLIASPLFALGLFHVTLGAFVAHPTCARF